MWTKTFWKDTGERVVSSLAQGALLGWGGTETIAPLEQYRWQAIGGAALGMAVLTLLKCLAASRKGNPTSASLVE